MKFDIVRAWKDDTYRQSLSEEQAGQLPANPAGEFELSDADLASLYGGQGGFGNNGPVTLQSGLYNRQHVSYICSAICSNDCDLDILNILDLG
jgi:mersacidin/lichenicidin family type 2 lantibiotic